MSARYNIDATKMSLKEFERSIRSRELIPSRKVLKNDLGKAFNRLRSMGINNLRELLDALKSKAKLKDLAKKSDLDENYMTLLKREANSYLPKPVKLSTFPGITQQIIAKLESSGIKNTRHLFDQTRTKADQKLLCKKVGVSVKELKELAGLSDLARLYGVGPVFARLLYDLSIDSVRNFMRFKPKEIIALYEKENQKKADFTESDIKFTLELAKILDHE